MHWIFATEAAVMRIRIGEDWDPGADKDSVRNLRASRRMCSLRLRWLLRRDPFDLYAPVRQRWEPRTDCATILQSGTRRAVGR